MEKKNNKVSILRRVWNILIKRHEVFEEPNPKDWEDTSWRILFTTSIFGKLENFGKFIIAVIVGIAACFGIIYIVAKIFIR